MEVKVKAEPIVEGLNKSLESMSKGILDMLQDLINQDPFCGHDFYDFVVFKLKDRTMQTHKLLHQPTLMKPNPFPGTSLFKINMKTKDVKLIWSLPLPEFIENFHESMFNHPNQDHKNFILKCIKDFKEGRLDPRPEEDPSPEEIQEILKELKKRSSIKKSVK